MKRPLRYIQQRLSIRLGIVIVLIITVVFMLLFSYLFNRGKRYIQHAAIDRATQLLDNTTERINGIMDETELTTNYMAQASPQLMNPDSLLALTRRMVEQNTVMQGFTIALEPDVLPQQGERFTVYSYRVADSIVSIVKNDYDYFDDPWYETPVKKKASCWLDPYQYAVPGIDAAPVWYFSFTTPFYSSDGRLVGVSCADLSLQWLSQAVSDVKPFPHSSAIMLGRDGRYIVHPDTSKLIRENIFSDAAPESRSKIEALGRDMLAGNSGMVETTVDGHDAFIFYCPLERTGWSIAIVCPESDVFVRYNRLVVTVWVIIAVGLMLLMLFCYQTVRRAVQPLSLLDEQVKRIADGHFDELLPESPRRDSVGRLTNSFIRMQQSLEKSVADIRRVNAEQQQQNDKLASAYQLKVETNQRKAAFIQDMYHKIRTPLNIISGFTQVLAANQDALPADEVDDITSRMKESADDIACLAHELDEAARMNNAAK